MSSNFINKKVISFLNQKSLKEKNKKKKRILLNKALILAQKNLDLNKKNYLAWKDYARILLHQKKFPKALKTYKKALQLSPINAKHYFYNGLGNVFRYMADYNPKIVNYYKKSISWYKKAIKKAPKQFQGLYWSNLSVAYANLKDWDNALKAVQKAFSLLKLEEKNGIKHGNQVKILELEKSLYKEYRKRTIL